ncbi:flagellar basal body-associated FliL family protein [Clostridium bornimense]|uniref:flagellar basal body-associated FliL family protein n=1 Tax=Clostridium bornimense TaxID=1216932 RepID=UPI001C0FA9EA|nr:flagellar basal body-associated FliL family protein [Clostridium bornimense]MBU5314760.1 flagellar basal body-associated FliL family protein [Clostridium bornimense]
MAKEEKKGGTLKIVVILLSLLLIVSVGFTSYMLLFKKPNEEVNKHALSGVEFYSLGDFKLNLADEGKYVQLTLQMGYRGGDETKEELEKKKDGPLRDAVINVISSKTVNDFKGDGKAKIKEEIKNAIAPLIEHGEVVDIWLGDIIYT